MLLRELHTRTPGRQPVPLRRPGRDTGGGLTRRRALGGACQDQESAVLNHGGYTRSAAAQGCCAECEAMGAPITCVWWYTVNFDTCGDPGCTRESAFEGGSQTTRKARVRDRSQISASITCTGSPRVQNALRE
jgi:hypothetical protein